MSAEYSSRESCSTINICYYIMLKYSHRNIVVKRVYMVFIFL